MITTCKKCGFSISDLMKFSLMKNVCPACGSPLFSNQDQNVLSVIQSKFSSARFSSKLSPELIYDISLFIFNELQNGLGDLVQPTILEHSEEEVEAEELSEKDKLRREIAEEYSEQLNTLTNDGEVIPEELQAKADRLKQLHQQKVSQNRIRQEPVEAEKTGKTGIRVNRVT